MLVASDDREQEKAYMRANLILKVAVLLDFDKFLLFLFFGACADCCSGYSMLVRIPSVKLSRLVDALDARVVHWPFRPSRSRKKATRKMV